MSSAMHTQIDHRHCSAFSGPAAWIVGALLSAIFVMSAVAPAKAQIISFESAALAGRWYAPDLRFYRQNPGYMLDFSGSVLAEAQLEFEVLRVAKIRTSIGHWEVNSAVDVDTDHPENARRHEATLRVVPVTLSLLMAPGFRRGPRPFFGVGVTQNLIQRSFSRTLLNGDADTELFTGNGRDFSFHGLLGLRFPIRGPVWVGIESRYVWGGFFEEQTETRQTQVALDGLQFGLSIRYHVR